jgi:predicted unusual protein kinase regulating ubiquinone biosynthesis (AarF/ABC1/UbiB family)
VTGLADVPRTGSIPVELPALPSGSTPANDTVSYSDKSYRWNRPRYSKHRRFVDIWSFVLTLLSGLWYDGKTWSYRGGVTEDKKAFRRQRQAAWVRQTFLELGPTFIKLGQLFSTRADLFPGEYVAELSKLQDQVPAFSYTQVEEIIEKDLGKKVTELFRSIDPVPLAAASLGQVHKALLHSGEEVVVKVQRPGLRHLFEIDLDILRGIAFFFQNHPDWGRGRDWIGIYEECCRILWEEIDYLNEGRNADTFRRNFRGRDWVKVPRVYWRYSSRRVLTLEYLPGIKISHYGALEAAGLDRKHLARLGAQAYLHQLLDDGLFHADPHPGNISVAPDGSLIFYDFGMMGRIRNDLREKLLSIFFGIAQKDAQQVVYALVEVGALVPTEDMSPVRRSIQFMLDNFMDKPFETQSIGAISEDLYEIAYDQPFRFPATFTFVMRAFSTLEGVGKGLDPEFNFMEVAQPFALELMSESGSVSNDFFNELGRQAAQVGNTAFGLPRRIEDTLDKLEQGDIRVRVRSSETDRLLRRLNLVQMSTSYAVLVGALIVSGTLCFIHGSLAGGLTLTLLASGVAVALLRLIMKINRFDRLG